MSKEARGKEVKVMKYYCPICNYECPYLRDLPDGDCGCILENAPMECDTFFGLVTEEYEIEEED